MNIATTSVTAGAEALYAAISRRTIAGLDGVRAIAVLAVVIHHAGWMRVNGSQGVLVFFTLSGFLITHLLLGEQQISLKRFYARRALRLFPAFYAYWLVMVALMLATHRPDPISRQRDPRRVGLPRDFVHRRC